MSQLVPKSKPWKTVICILSGWKISRIPAVPGEEKQLLGRQIFTSQPRSSILLPHWDQAQVWGWRSTAKETGTLIVSTAQPAPVNFMSTRNHVRMTDQPYYNLACEFFTYSDRFYTWRRLNKGHWNFSCMHTVPASTLPAKLLEIAASFKFAVTTQPFQLLIQHQAAKGSFRLKAGGQQIPTNPSAFGH